jgi:FlaA1/EpsC-like NDP-sugar epimerase
MKIVNASVSFFVDRFFSSLFRVSRALKQCIAIFFDSSACVIGIYLALTLRYSSFPGYSSGFILLTVLSVIIAIPIFWIFGLYKGVFRFSGAHTLGNVIVAVISYCAVLTSLLLLVEIPGVPRSLPVFQSFVLVTFIASSRLALRALAQEIVRGRGKYLNRRGVLVYGTSSYTRHLAQSLRDSDTYYFRGFVEDDSSIWGSSVDGHMVYPSFKLREVLSVSEVEEIWLTLGDISEERRITIIESMRDLGVHVRYIPSLSELAGRFATVNDVHELGLSDILGRAPVRPDINICRGPITNKVVLVTGAGGSIGSELCRQIISLSPSKLVLLDMSELALFNIHRELISRTDISGESIMFVPVLASTTDSQLIKSIFLKWCPDTVFHAAAYKHVSMVERNICAAVLNNVFGTLNCVQSAIDTACSTFVLVSTDKAVRPTNVMGATKRLAELLLHMQVPGLHRKPIFLSVRFGNVIDSSGSVVPLFREQISNGGPVTVTHRDVTRYFMSIPEAAQLLLQAAGMAVGDEVFLLEMGEPVKIYDLARRMIEFSGLTVKNEACPTGDVEIKIIGLRPGEKLFEELLIEGSPERTLHPKIWKAHEEAILPIDFTSQINELRISVEANNFLKAKELLALLVQEYSPADEVVDWALQH